MNQLKRTKTFYNKKGMIKDIVLRNTGSDEIIYGQSAINKQLPTNLRVYTEDYDIFAKDPRKEARQLERALDKYFGGNYFRVKPAIHKGTFRVVSYIDGKTYADYTLMPKKIPYTKIGGRNYITLEYAKKDKRKILRNPQAKYRHAKDRDALNRIRLGQELNKKPNVLNVEDELRRIAR